MRKCHYSITHQPRQQTSNSSMQQQRQQWCPMASGIKHQSRQKQRPTTAFIRGRKTTSMKCAININSNAFTAKNPFWGINLLEVSIGRDFGGIKGQHFKPSDDQSVNGCRASLPPRARLRTSTPSSISAKAPCTSHASSGQ